MAATDTKTPNLEGGEGSDLQNMILLPKSGAGGVGTGIFHKQKQTVMAQKERGGEGVMLSCPTLAAKKLFNILHGHFHLILVGWLPPLYT